MNLDNREIENESIDANMPNHLATTNEKIKVTWKRWIVLILSFIIGCFNVLSPWNGISFQISIIYGIAPEKLLLFTLRDRFWMMTFDAIAIWLILTQDSWGPQAEAGSVPLAFSSSQDMKESVS